MELLRRTWHRYPEFGGFLGCALALGVLQGRDRGAVTGIEAFVGVIATGLLLRPWARRAYLKGRPPPPAGVAKASKPKPVPWWYVAAVIGAFLVMVLVDVLISRGLAVITLAVVAAAAMAIAVRADGRLPQ